MVTPKWKQRGTGLIEVLVSLVILSVGILGVMGMQARSTQFNHSSTFQIKATILAEDYFDRMRGNPGSENLYAVGFGDAVDSYTDCQQATASCTVAELAAYDKGTWLEEVVAVLPNVDIRVQNDPPGLTYVIDIRYNDSRLDLSAKSGQGATVESKLVSFRTTL